MQQAGQAQAGHGLVFVLGRVLADPRQRGERRVGLALLELGARGQQAALLRERGMRIARLHVGEHARGALGGAGNVERVDECAETRLRVVLRDPAGVDENGLTIAGVDAIVRLPANVVHLLVGLNADQYAAEMRGQLALPLAA